MMKILTVTSLLSIVLFSIHLTDDIVRGFSPGGLENLFAILILVVWLYGTLVLAGRRSGRIIVLVASLFAAAMPVIHMRGAGVGGEAFLFIWTLLALGVTGTFSVILAVRALRFRSADGTMTAVAHENPDRRG